ncbi:MAG TPA: MATE family efflux transporter [Acidimicrobiia bacterium]
MRVERRSIHDREILRLALPALGALAVEPLYVLVDTAIVGHLGTDALGGLAVAGAVLVAVFNIFNFLAYSTTAAVARRVGAGDRRAAAELGIAGVWLAVGLGVVIMVVGLVVAPAVVDLMGASPEVTPPALTYLRISLLGAPFMLLMLAGMGYARGLQDTRTTLVVAVGSNVVNLGVEIVLVYGLDLGIAGSAWSTVIAQASGALCYVWLLARSVRGEGAAVRPRVADIRETAVVGGQLVLRTGSLLLALTAATAVASRIGDDAVAAHQVAFQIWLFLALSLDAVAIAGQAMIGRFLGADDATNARTAARRMVEWGVAAGVVLGVVLALVRALLVPIFTDDPAVRDLALEVLLLVALLQPVNAVVFVLDGVLIGAGDATYLAAAMAGASFLVFAPAAVLVLVLDGSLLWLWGAICLFMSARLVGNVARFAGTRWQVTGAARGT